MKRLMKLLLILLSTSFASSILADPPVRAVWLYEFDTWKNQSNFGNRLQMASALGFNQIYLGVLSDKLDEMGPGEYGTKMVEFVTQASSLNIAVHATTLQTPHFTFEEGNITGHTNNQSTALDRITEILVFNHDYQSAAFAGIHIDPEPHILTCNAENALPDAPHPCTMAAWETHGHALWTTPDEQAEIDEWGSFEAWEASTDQEDIDLVDALKERRDLIMDQFVSLLEDIRVEIDDYNDGHDPDLIFSSTVGWWYNERRAGQGNGYLPTGAADLTEPARLDIIVPMVYSGGVGESVTNIIQKVSDEIQEAGAPTIIGISIESLDDFAGVYDAMKRLESTDEGFGNYTAFKGVSVFQFKFLEAMPSVCPTVVVHNDLYQWVFDNIIKVDGPEAQKTMPRERNSEADDYDVPTPAQLVLWNDMLGKVLAHDADPDNITEACAMASQLGYELIDFQESSTGQNYYLLKTIPYDAATNPDPHFWGTYILNRNPVRSNLIIQAPHPFWDMYTEEEGVEVFRLTGALFYMMAGTSRCNLLCDTPPGGSPGGNCSSCSGSTTACNSGVSYRYSIADMAHNEGSVFHETTKKLSNNLRYFIQLHGFGWDSGDPYAIISNGTSEPPEEGYDPLPVLEDMLRHQIVDLPLADNSICIVHEDWSTINADDACYKLKGFDNTQGRFLNGGTSPCTSTAGVSPTGKFIHIEQEETKFRDDRSDWGKVARAIANTFQVELEVESIEDTDGLLPPTNYPFEPQTYTYDFLAPFKSKLLYKNSHLGPTATDILPGAITSGTYENDEAVSGTLSSSGTISSSERVWFLAEESIVLTEGFQATSTDFFVAELKKEEPYCDPPGPYLPDDINCRYFTSVYGPRMTSSGTTITRGYDFHRGMDMVEMDDDNQPAILSMCDGKVVEKDNDTDEGNYITVECEAEFNENSEELGKIHIAYRHLDSFGEFDVEDEIRKGDTIGIMGKTGAAANNHLHMSVMKTGGNPFINLHPMRVFNPAVNTHLNLKIDEAPVSEEEEDKKKERVNIFLLDYSNTSGVENDNYATFRIAVPYNKMNIRAVIVRHDGETENKIADFEQISKDRDGNQAWLDDPVVGDLTLFPLPFVRAEFSAYNRYNQIKGDFCNPMTGNKVCDHPVVNFPVLDEGIFTTPAYVLDVKAKGLPQFFDPFDFQVDVLDIWGNGVRGTMTPPPNMLLGFPANGQPQAIRPTSASNDQHEKTAQDVATANNQAIKLYPNPTAGNELFVELKGAQAETAEIEVLNLAGKLMFTLGALVDAESRTKIDVGSLAPGAYLVRVKTDLLNSAGMFIKQ